MMAMLGFVMVCCDGLMFGLCDGWWIFHSSKHSKTDGHAWHYIALHNKTQCNGIMWRAYTRRYGGGVRAPMHPRRHTRTNCMLNTYYPHTLRSYYG